MIRLTVLFAMAKFFDDHMSIEINNPFELLVALIGYFALPRIASNPSLGMSVILPRQLPFPSACVRRVSNLSSDPGIAAD